MRVMIIGASNDRRKFGNKAVRAFRRAGHIVLPVNPRESEVEGLRCFSSVADVPGPIDRASFYIPAPAGLAVVRDLAARGDVGEVWLNPGAESEELVAECRRLGFEPVQACSIIAIGERP
jgi:predicted CoA-binding protein